MVEQPEFPFYRAVRVWCEARRAVTDSDWKKGECTPAMIQRLASAEMALVSLIGNVENKFADLRAMETAPRDGTEILAYGRYCWAGDWRLPDFSRGELGWAVVRWVDKRDDPLVAEDNHGKPDFDKVTATGVWELVHANPYVDWMDATHWLPVPDLPKRVEK